MAAMQLGALASGVASGAVKSAATMAADDALTAQELAVSLNNRTNKMMKDGIR